MIRQEISKTAISDFVRDVALSGSRSFQPPADFSGFDGHFPGYPIMPAMLQVLFGIVVAEEVVETGLILKKLDKAKFMVQIKPEEIMRVSCRINNPDERQQSEIQAKITITVAENKVASMVLWLEPLNRETSA